MIYTFVTGAPETRGITRPMRHITLEGAYNVRDIGGYAVAGAGNKRTRWGMLLRGDGMHRLTHADQRLLIGQGLKTIIDLRFASEAALWPNVFVESSAMAYINVPLHEDPLAPSANIGISPAHLPQTLAEYYCAALDRAQKSMKKVIDLLSSPRGLPAIVHCTAGKDRTGLVTAVLLSLLGVDQETIVEDYMLTERFAAPLLVKLQKQIYSRGQDVEWHRRMLECKPGAMSRALAHLELRYGGAEQYLLDAGVNQGRIEYLRASLVE